MWKSPRRGWSPKVCNKLVAKPTNKTSRNNAPMRTQKPARGMAAVICGDVLAAAAGGGAAGADAKGGGPEADASAAAFGVTAAAAAAPAAGAALAVQPGPAMA